MKTNFLNPILFDVEKVETSKVTSMSVNPENQYSIVGTMSDGSQKFLYTCSDKYDIVPNSLIFPKLESLFRKNKATKEFERRVVNIEDAIFYVYYTFPKIGDFVRSVGDVIQCGYWAANSYNGKINVRGGDFAKRLVCSNGLTAMSKTMAVDFKHKDGQATAGVEQLFLQAMSSIENFEHQVVQYNLLASAERKRKWEDRLEKVGKEAGIPKYHDAAKEIVRREKKELGLEYVNDWLIYNAFNQIIMGSQFSDGVMDYNKKNPQLKQNLDEKIFEVLLNS